MKNKRWQVLLHCILLTVLLLAVPLNGYGATITVEHRRSRSDIVDLARRLEQAEFYYDVDFKMYLNEFRREYDDNPAEDHLSVEHQMASTYIDRLYYKELPVFIAPYAAGTLNAKPLSDGINALKMVRYLAGLPVENLTLNPDLNNSAQHRAVLATILDSTDGVPKKPANMSELFYKTALAEVLDATTQELSYVSLSSSFSVTGIAEVILDLVRNPGSAHIATAEYRLALLNPAVTDVGFGYANDYSKPRSTSVFGNLGIWGHYYYLHTNNPENTLGSAIETYLAWPNSGDFPLQYFVGVNYEQQAPVYPWSLTLGTGYQVPSRDSMVLSLTRKRDGKVWVFDATTPNFGERPENYGDHSLDHLSVENSTIIFRPNLRDLGTLQREDVFIVSLTGIKTSSGAPASLTYDITFFDLDQELQALGDKLRVVSTLPVIGDMEVSSQPVIEILFSMPISDLTESNVTLHKEHFASEPLEVTVQISQSNPAVLLIKVVSELEADTWYRVQIKPESVAVAKNVYFRGLTKEEDFYFKTTREQKKQAPKSQAEEQPVLKSEPQPDPEPLKVAPVQVVAPSEPSILVVIPEIFQGQESAVSLVEGLVIQELIERDLPVTAHSISFEVDDIRSSLGTDQNTFDNSNRALGAEFLVMGLASAMPIADVHGLLSYRGFVEVQVVNLARNQIIARQRLEATGLDITAESATKKALAQAGEEMARYVADVLIKELSNKE